jgi:hypothetical protein
MRSAVALVPVGAAFVFAVASAGCDRSPASGGPDPGDGGGAGALSRGDLADGARAAATAPDGGGAAVARGSIAGNGSGGAGTGGAASGAWRGSYRSTAAELYIPPDWKVRYVVPETTAGLGDGGLWFRVDPETQRVLGALDGPLGPATIEGTAAGGKLAATIRPDEPGPAGFAGTLVGAIATDRAEGTMRMSPGEASPVRAASFVVTPGAAPR